MTIVLLTTPRRPLDDSGINSRNRKGIEMIYCAFCRVGFDELTEHTPCPQASRWGSHHLWITGKASARRTGNGIHIGPETLTERALRFLRQWRPA